MQMQGNVNKKHGCVNTCINSVMFFCVKKEIVLSEKKQTTDDVF